MSGSWGGSGMRTGPSSLCLRILWGARAGGSARRRPGSAGCKGHARWEWYRSEWALYTIYAWAGHIAEPGKGILGC